MIPIDETFPFIMTRKQFPVRLCFAITSNKSQGQTLEKVGIFLDSPFFSHGQYYVAQSRVGSSDALRILVASGGQLQSTSQVYIDNVLYPEILES